MNQTHWGRMEADADGFAETFARFLSTDGFDVSELMRNMPKDTVQQRHYQLMFMAATAKQVESLGKGQDEMVALAADHKKEFNQLRRIVSILLSFAVFFGAQFYDVELGPSIFGALVSILIPNGKSFSGFFAKVFLS